MFLLTTNLLYIMTLFQVTWLETDLFTLGLGFLMLSMGLTLTFDDFRRCLRNPWTVRDTCLCLKLKQLLSVCSSYH